MTLKDALNLHRFVGFVEGIAYALPTGTQTLLYDYLEVVNNILDKELDHQTEKGGGEE